MLPALRLCIHPSKIAIAAPAPPRESAMPGMPAWKCINSICCSKPTAPTGLKGGRPVAAALIDGFILLSPPPPFGGTTSFGKDTIKTLVA